jgi:hypothetical protein
MGLFRSAMGLFRGRAGKNREKMAAELPEEQAKTAAELPEEQAKTVKAQPEVAPREVKYEARPNPDKPGWGLTIGQEIRKAREDRASQE